MYYKLNETEGNYLRTFRFKNGIKSNEDIISMLHCSPILLREIERGKMLLPDSLKQKIEEICNIKFEIGTKINIKEKNEICFGVSHDNSIFKKEKQSLNYQTETYYDKSNTIQRKSKS